MAVLSGSFDLTGLLALARERARSMRARWIAFDAIDVLLDLLPDVTTRSREIARLQHWLDRIGLNCILTAKAGEVIEIKRLTPSCRSGSYLGRRS